MKKPVIFPCLFAALLLAVACSSIDIKPESDPDRVVTGAVHIPPPAELPPDAVVVVRLLNATANNAPPVLLAEQVIKNPTASPVPFRVEYRADEALLSLGLNLEARISVGGKLRFYNVNSYTVTASNASDPLDIWVNPTGK